MQVAAVVAVMTALSLTGVSAKNDGQAKTPPMGWRSWNLFRENITQALIEGVLHGMVSRKRLVDGVPTSLCDLGYCTVGLDDAWQQCAWRQGYWYHNATGHPMINFDRFPDMAAMTSLGHSLGLKMGWYGNNCICGEGTNATHQMYEQDVRYLTERFNFDSVKLDGCGSQKDLQKWSDLIDTSGHTVEIEACHWGLPTGLPTETWCPFHTYRTSYDIRPWYSLVVRNLLSTVHFADSGLSRPGCWAYPDMLEVGSPWDDASLTFVESRSHFGAWCIVSSPLTLSHDPGDDNITDQIWEIISNKEAIAINQDWAGHSGSPFLASSANISISGHIAPKWQYFRKPLSDGKVAVLMMNHDTVEQQLTLDPNDVPGLACGGAEGPSCNCRDVWAHQDLPELQGPLTVTLPSHDSAFLVLSATAGASHLRAGALRASRGRAALKASA